MQVLYRIDITAEPPETALADFWKEHAGENVAEEVKGFTGELVKGTAQNLGAIDAMIASHATNWQLKRMATVDRNILRMGCYELVFRADIPPKVSINEAVELAKRFSSLEAGKFVNAVLDKIKIEHHR